MLLVAEELQNALDIRLHAGNQHELIFQRITEISPTNSAIGIAQVFVEPRGHFGAASLHRHLLCPPSLAPPSVSTPSVFRTACIPCGGSHEGSSIPAAFRISMRLASSTQYSMAPSALCRRRNRSPVLTTVSVICFGK